MSSRGNWATLRRLGPGLALLVGLGLFASGITTALGVGSALIVAIGAGIVVGNTVGLSERTTRGVETDTLWLKVGIILMGASITLETIVAAGPRLLGVVVGAVALSLLLVELFARSVFDVPQKVGSLLAAGTSICGVSAVAAVSGSIDPDGKHVAYAAATVLVFDVITLVTYPVVGRMLGLPDIVYGIWAGTTMFSTGPVTAAGFAYSDVAGEWAVLAKLTRNALIGLVAMTYALYYSKQRRGDGHTGGTTAYLWETFPKFIIGFVGLMLLANVGLFGPADIAVFQSVSDWLFLLAFAGLGLRIDVDSLRSTGVMPATMVGLTLTLVSALTLVTLLWLF